MKEYGLLFGPAHPGSGNFSVNLRVEGEEVVSARADPGYLHRGFEKLMEYRTPMQNAVLSDRICVFEALNWNLVHAEAVDELNGVEAPERARYIRVVMAELSRIQSHILWYGAMSMGLGFDTGFKIAFGYRDYLLDVFELITGGRVYPAGYVCPGGVRRDLPAGAEGKILGVLGKVGEMLAKISRFEETTVSPRMKGIGVLKKGDAVALGATGPVLRASGVKSDVRRDDPYEVYSELDFDVPVQEAGDAYDRYTLIKAEIMESMKIVRQALDKMPDGEVKTSSSKPATMGLPEGEAYVRNEVARGEGGIYMVGVGGESPYRCKIRGPSLLHMIPVLEHLLVGSQVADVPAIYWSLNICPADMDR